MDRRSFIKRFGMGVLAASMVRDALLSPIYNQAQLMTRDPARQVYHYVKYGLGYTISKEMIEDDCYGFESLLSTS